MTKSHSDKFSLTSLSTHLKWIFGDLEKGEIYGIPENLFFRPKKDDPFRMTRYGQLLETPIGVAAGPQTQLVQNIVSAWLTGSRYLELKTIQVLDELEVTKPCIDMADEGYNCEWSQELKLDQSFNEYLNAFIILYILKDKLKIGEAGEAGFIFNMSAGYNLEGIQSPSVQRFFDRMTNCEAELAAKLEEAAKIYPRVKELNIPGKISDNLTVSTMHGCPPEEVEKIGSYFITQRGFHTTIKLNPTLIGADTLRSILNDKLGFQTWVPDEAFGHDLKYPDGVNLIKSLSVQAQEAKVQFALKLTNTLETQNQLQNLPKSEGMVYMSGRSLHAISVNLAAKLQKEFDGQLDISFSAGADYKNLPSLIAGGLKPVTVSSDALRPGGYGRMSQYLEVLGQTMREARAFDIDSFIAAKGGGKKGQAAALANLLNYAAEVLDDPRYKKEDYVYKNGVKTKRALSRFNCFAAPCMETCPASQDIPRYLNYTARGEYELAYQTIMATNPFPNVQGAVCDHQCQFKCTRLNYDTPLKIREIKRFIAEKHQGPTGLKAGAANGLSVAIIGAGPGGLSAAHYLAIADFKVEMFEAKPRPGGMAADAIPAFRLSDDSLKKDIDNILSLGVKLNLNHKVDRAGLEKMRQDFDYVYLAIGAQANTRLGIENEDAQGVMDQLTFLSQVRRGEKTGLGKNVIVLGAGNSAMDVARTARRLGSEVTIVYRRTRREMPADPDEIREALEEGVKLVELSAPEKVLVKDGKVSGLSVCSMRLGEPDASGRARPVKVEGSEHDIQADTVIAAIGQDLRLDVWPESKLEMDPKTGLTQLAKVYTGGDAGRGASSLIQAIADGRQVAHAISEAAHKEARLPAAPADDRLLDIASLRFKQGRRLSGPQIKHKAPADRLNFNLFTETYTDEEARAEAARCLQCDQLCNICTTVCPNRANLAIPGKKLTQPIQKAVVKGGKVEIVTEGIQPVDQAFQIFNLADFCNECGNCAAFCPTSGAPYMDKFRVHLSKESYDNGPDGFHFPEAGLVLIKRGGEEATLKVLGNALKYSDKNMTAELDSASFEARSAGLSGGLTETSLVPAAEAAVVWSLLSGHHLFKA
ncbi:putative selenate reductase subunit YgfK [Deltaproteobacteria bacterium Smac51]|nr:putative selenate reductase subunit YgfK [Deltaproteobacteria bacterium Smac51]